MRKPILVVEDDRHIREALCELLQGEGYNVVTEANGLAGLRKLRKMPRRSLVLLDMMMPVMDGRGFLDAVLSDTSLMSTPIVVLSANLTAENTAGAVACMRKPLDLEVLLNLVALHTAASSNN